MAGPARQSSLWKAALRYPNQIADLRRPGERMKFQTPALIVMLLCACSAEAAQTRRIEILSISPTLHDATASTQSMPECKNWRLSKREAQQFFALAARIDGFEYHERYDHAPCRVTGTVRMDEVVWQFEINGAAKATLRGAAGRGSWHMGCDKAQCKPLFVLMPWTESDDG